MLTTKGITEDDQWALKEYFPGEPGIHMPSGCPNSLAHREKLFNGVMTKKRSGQSVGGVRPGNPLQVTELPGADLLTDQEFELCCGLRLTPAQYFQSRKTLLDNFWDRGWFNKSAAQKMLRIDVKQDGQAVGIHGSPRMDAVLAKWKRQTTPTRPVGNGKAKAWN